MLDQYETEISKVLEGVAELDHEQGGLSDREWTRRIKEGLCVLGKQKGYGVSAAGCAGADTGEWLFDFVWAASSDVPEQFTEMPLAMECEWSVDFDDIAWDFEKLLVAKANHKVMVFQQSAESDIREVMAQLKKMITAFKTRFPGERYCLAGYAFDEHRFYYEVV